MNIYYRVQEYMSKNKGLTEAEAAKKLGVSHDSYRASKSYLRKKGLISDPVLRAPNKTKRKYRKRNALVSFGNSQIPVDLLTHPGQLELPQSNTKTIVAVFGNETSIIEIIKKIGM